jgi:hypothetical protein
VKIFEFSLTFFVKAGSYRMHNGEAKIADLVGEHLQTKEKTRMGGEG